MTPIRTLRGLALVAALSAGGFACSEDLDDGKTEAPAPTPDEAVIDNGDGTWSLTVDASAAELHIDLGDGSAVAPDGGWDLSFTRFEIGVNGGEGGDGEGAAVWIAGATLASVDVAPAEGWVQDAPDDDDDDTLLQRAMGDWYDYDAQTHVLTPKAGVYALRGAAARAYYAVRIDSYYDAAGTSGVITFTWREIAAPEGVQPAPEPQPEAQPEPQPEPEAQPEPEPQPEPLPADAVEVDVTGEDWVLLHVGETVSVVAEGDPWDVAIQGVFLQTNSGTSGDGLAGVRRTELVYDAIADAPTMGYAMDATVALPGPPGSGEASGNPVFNDTADPWYAYNPASHQVSALDRAYLLRTHDGGYARFQIVAYAGGLFHIRGSRIDAAPEIVELTNAAPDDWAYVNLRDGASVEIEDAATSLDWDLGTWGTRVRTNGGTSGAGLGGAYAAEDPAMGDAASCVLDAMVPEPGPPGAGEFSGSPTLGAWYDYNPMTHAVTPKDTDWVVCTADGGFARVRITDYADGALTFEWRYAGLGGVSF